MKKKWFSPALYVEGLRQLRTIGILYIIIIEIGAILSYAYRAIEPPQYTMGHSTAAKPINMLNANLILSITVIIFASIMVLSIFQFLNKRNASDFYHTIPQARISIFLSFYPAVLTWMFAGILLSFLTSIVGYFGFGSRTPIASETIISSLLFILAACFYVTSVLLLAMNLSGTLFNNMAVAALIALAPRLLMNAFTGSLVSSAQILPIWGLSGLLSDIINPLFYLFYFTLRSNSYSLTLNTVTILDSALYSFIIGLLFIAAALVLFNHRRSETAGLSTPNRVLQTIFRLTVAMAFCLTPCTQIIQSFTSSFPFQIDKFYFILMYTLALLGYFLYELITTKKVKNLLRSIPALAILVLLNIGFIGGCFGIREMVLNNTPSADEIRGATILSDNNYIYDSYGCLQSSSVYTNKRIESEIVNKIVSNNLNEDIQLIKANNYIYSRLETGHYYIIKIESSKQTLYRNIFISDSDFQKIKAEFKKS